MRFPKTRFSKFVSNSAVTVVAIALFTMMSAVGSASAATCTNASFKGVYGFFSQGFVNSEPLANIGLVTSSGTGTLTGTITRTLDGVQETASISGSYTVAKTCAGTITYTEGSATYNFSIDLNESNKAFQLIETDLGATVIGFVQPLGAATCGLSGKAVTYAFNGFGAEAGVGSVGYGGQLKLDGKGNITGTIDISTKGTITTGVAVTGTYTQASDCTGTVVLNPTGFATIDFNSYAVNANKELLLIDTVGGMTVGGNIQ
jgi:hypothetical protein